MQAGSGGGGEMTLAFSRAAVTRLADPNAAFEDARRWSQHVGLVDDDGDAVASTVAEHDLQQDFDVGDRDKWLAMAEIREATRTSRHVYVGASPEDRQVATHLGWEFVPVTEAAEKAEWTLSGDADDGGTVARLRRLLPIGLWPLGSN